MENKTCGGCKVSKPLTEFNRRGSGHSAWCRSCGAAYKKKWSEQNAAKAAASNNAWNKANPQLRWLNHFKDRSSAYGFTPVYETITRDMVVGLYGDGCFHCHAGAFEELDHFPVSVKNGGSHTLGNVRPSCIPCNKRGPHDNKEKLNVK